MFIAMGFGYAMAIVRTPGASVSLREAVEAPPSGGNHWGPTSKVAQRPGSAIVKRVCEDTCLGHASNGVCDEGRPALLEGHQTDISTFEVFCDLGTDCSDCGAWVHNNTVATDGWQPIQEIRAKNVNTLSCCLLDFFPTSPSFSACGKLSLHPLVI